MTKDPLHPRLARWFASRGWTPHAHQLTLLRRAAMGGADLLIAPTGGGKTLAGFLPSLCDLAEDPAPGLHTLYVSPLKALASDIRRNLAAPVAEADLPIRIEDRTGDTGQTARRRQRADPPHILLTTPESLALMLSWEDAPRIFGGLRRVIADEIHALSENKRGDQLALCLARLETLAARPLHRIGLSATVEDPAALAAWFAPGDAAPAPDVAAQSPEVAGAAPSPHDAGAPPPGPRARGRSPLPEPPIHGARLLLAEAGAKAEIGILDAGAPPPWAGAGGRHAAEAVLARIREARMTLVFINTRAQAELFFQALWAVNAENMPIGLHHGSLSREARAKVEEAMADGRLKAVVCTGSLDLGIDWQGVDLVIQVGAPKNVKRLVQRIGRANHRWGAPSRALLVPANRFEELECRAALEAAAEHDLDGEPRGAGGLDVLCRHILATACAGPFCADALFTEIRRAGGYQALSRADFDACLDFCATGGYALRAYDRWRRLMETPDGMHRLRDPRSARIIRMNLGTIVDSEKLSVRLAGKRGGGPKLGEVEEAFAAALSPGDTFLIGGEVVRMTALREMSLEVERGGREPKIAVFSGTKLAASTLLSRRVLAMLEDPEARAALPPHTRDWLRVQEEVSALPRRDGLLVETFPRAGREHLCIYGFAGRNAHQTLGLLLTRRMEAAGLAPLGFVCADHALLIWGLEEVRDPAALLSPADLREGLETWLAGNAVMKRTFRAVATIAGLIERNQPGARKSGRQASFSSDILYDTLRRHDPDHLLLRATRQEAMRGLVDFDRIEEMCARAAGRIRHMRAPHATPLAAPLLLEAGRVPIAGAGAARLEDEAAAALMREAGIG